MVLVLNQKYYDALVEAVLFGGHSVVGMREHAWLEDSRQVLRVHPVLVRLRGEHGEEIEKVEEKLPVQRR
jgi:hypothetical protein